MPDPAAEEYQQPWYSMWSSFHVCKEQLKQVFVVKNFTETDDNTANTYSKFMYVVYFMHKIWKILGETVENENETVME